MCTATAFATNDSDYTLEKDDITPKEQLVQSAEEYAEKNPQIKSNPLSSEEVMDLIIECEQNNLSYEQKKDILNSNGIFQLDPSQSDILLNPIPSMYQSGLFDGSDLALNTPSVYYSMNTYTWFVSVNGTWNEDDIWHRHSPKTNEAIGSPDEFGVGFSNISGEVPQRLSARGWFNNGDVNNEITTTNVARGSSGTGFGFQLQDRWINHVDGSMGQRFGGVAEFNSTFARYHGYATAYYIHTWEQGRVTGINFNVSAGLDSIGGGIGVTFENVAYTFAQSSGGQAKF